MTEAELQKHAIERLVAAGWLVMRINQGKKRSRGKVYQFITWFSKFFKDGKAQGSGVSDLYCLAPNGRTYALEVKAPGRGDQASDIQNSFLREVRIRGGSAMVLHHIGQLDNLIFMGGEVNRGPASS